MLFGRLSWRRIKVFFVSWYQTFYSTFNTKTFTYALQIRWIITLTFRNKAIFSFFRIDWIISLLPNVEGSIFLQELINSVSNLELQTLDNDSSNRRRQQLQHFQWCFSLHLKMFWPLPVQPRHFLSDIFSPTKTSNHKLFYNFRSLVLYSHQKPNLLNRYEASKLK